MPNSVSNNNGAGAANRAAIGEAILGDAAQKAVSSLIYKPAIDRAVKKISEGQSKYREALKGDS